MEKYIKTTAESLHVVLMEQHGSKGKHEKGPKHIRASYINSIRLKTIFPLLRDGDG